jgi:cellulose biosynthesis protein BcsQ
VRETSPWSKAPEPLRSLAYETERGALAKRVALFNHKGGVSKTTTAFNLAWKFAETGHRTLVVDTDPQCNLTGLVMGLRGPEELENFYTSQPNNNIYEGLVPAFESRPAPIAPLDAVPVPDRDGMYLLPGSIRLSEYETTLGIAQELSGSIQTLQNLPGAIAHLIDATAGLLDVEFVVIDMSPGLGAINQNLMATADYFLVPAAPDFFSVMAMDSLARVVPRWSAWSKQAASMEVLRQAAYPFPEVETKFLGTVIQNFRPRGGAPASSFQRWIDQMEDAVETRLVPALEAAGLLLPDSVYEDAHVSRKSLNLALIPDFNSLVALSQQCQKPVYALTEEDVEASGVVLEGLLRNRDQFGELFDDLAAKVVSLTA